MFHDLQNPFTDIDTEYKCLSHFEKDLGIYSPPQEITIDPNDYNTRRDKNSLVNNQKICFQFMPVRKSLKMFFEMPGVLKSTLDYISDLENDTTILSNLIQTEYWQMKKRLFQNRLVLPLYIYWDEYETNNPLGSHRGVGKVGAVYIVIACLHPQLQSKVENIFILTLFKSINLDEIPLHTFFSNAIRELKFLEETGITVSTSNGTEQIFFSVAAFIGDNLAVHAVLGFTMGFTANYPCRFCHVKSSDMKLIVKESQCELRNEQSYERDLIEDAPRKTGVVKQSAISDLKYSSTLELMAVDAAHDILEGVLEYDLGLVLHQFIEVDHFFTLAEINSRIDSFNYGPNETNKPRPIKPNQIKNRHIKMSASEALSFIRNLALLIGDLIPRNNKHWKLISLLKEIIDIITSPIVSMEVLDYLQSILSEYFRKLNMLFENAVKPKHHLLVHYASVSRRFGPVWNLATLRCKSKNRISKMASHASRNRQNITKTIAIKSQLELAARFLRNESVVIKPYECQIANELFVTDLPDVNLYYTVISDLALEHTVKHVDSLLVQGHNIRRNTVVMIPGENDPELYLVHVMLEVEQGNIVIVAKKLTCSNIYDHHFQAYELYSDALTNNVNWCRLTIEHLRAAYISFVTKNINGKLYIPKRWI